MPAVPSSDSVVLDRRHFLTGGWRRRAAGPPSSRSAIRAARVAILVQATPARRDAVGDAVRALDGVRVSESVRGRLIAEVPADAVAATLQTLSGMPGVLTASVLPASVRPADHPASPEIAP